MSSSDLRLKECVELVENLRIVNLKLKNNADLLSIYFTSSKVHYGYSTDSLIFPHLWMSVPAALSSSLRDILHCAFRHRYEITTNLSE